MPLTFQALPHCCTSSSSNSRTAVAPNVYRWRTKLSSFKASPSCFTSSPLFGNLSLSSLSGARFLGSRNHSGGPGAVRRWRNSEEGKELSVISYHEEEDGSRNLIDRNSVEQNVVSRRMEALKVALVAGLVGLQVCLPAFAGSLGLEVARSTQSPELITDLSDFQSGFTSAFLLIFFSEIGDKTFFIAALLATRKSNLAVFTGTFGALAAMTVISVTLGRAFHYLDNILPDFGTVPLPLDDLAAVVLLVYFGISTLVEAASMDGSKVEEEQQEAELAIAGVSGDGVGLQAAVSTVAATFALVFVAEWGDKSFFSTIALAAASSPVGVVTGAIAGHGVATILAVLGGSFLSTYISEKLIAYVGGVLFLVFAAATLVDILK